jgi:RimJ/RimL family protein N-acetyltransferase
VTGQLTYRPVGLGDAPWVADLLTACHPDDAWDPATLRHRWQTWRPQWWQDRVAIFEDDRAVGVAEAEHPPWEQDPERNGSLWWFLLPTAADAAGPFLEEMERRLRQAGTRRLLASCREDDQHLKAAMEGAGYRLERTERVWELDLVGGRERLLALTEASRRRMREQGIRLLTLAEDGDPQLWPALTRLHNETEADIPRSHPFHPRSEPEVKAFFEDPSVHPERVWVARAGEDLAAISYLTFPERGVSWTGYTACARAFRGQGIARAVKMETLAQAIALGVERVRTSNDGANAPILHINQTLGYRPVPGWLEYLRLL